jgi:polyhydroxybutyrate depolymerase
MRFYAALTVLQIVYSKSSGCGATAQVAPGVSTEQKLHVGSDQRRYLLTLPKDYDPNKPYPLVLSFHGYGMDAETLADYDGTVPQARSGDVIAVHPDGADDVVEGPKWRSWNAVGSSATTGASSLTCDQEVVQREYQPQMLPKYASCPNDGGGCGWTTCMDDVAFVEQMLNAVEGAYCVDQSQVRLQGESNGGMLVYELLQSRLAQRFTTMTAMIASPASFVMKPPAAPVRFLGIWGGADRIMPIGTPDGPDKVTSREGFFYSSSYNTTRALAKGFGCDTEPEVALSHSRLECKSYQNCKQGEVMQCILKGQRHVWPWWTDVLINSFNKRKIAPVGPFANFWNAYVDNRTQIKDPDEWEAQQHGNATESLHATVPVVDKWTSNDSGLVATVVNSSFPLLPKNASQPGVALLSRKAKSLSVFTKQAAVHRVLLRP